MLVAINKTNGSMLFEVPLSRYSWVSPIAVYDQNGAPTLYVPTVNGFVLLVDGLTGEVVFSQDMGCIFESSPIAWNNRIIQPARGNKIYSFVIE
jgi:outer membrane protein assembly factor BamB